MRSASSSTSSSPARGLYEIDGPAAGAGRGAGPRLATPSAKRSGSGRRTSAAVSAQALTRRPRRRRAARDGRREPERRYGSAGELAADLARVLDGRPVLAREPSAGYLVRRFAARHKGAVFASAVTVVGVMTALSVAVWQLGSPSGSESGPSAAPLKCSSWRNALGLEDRPGDLLVPSRARPRRGHLIADEAREYLERLAGDAGSNLMLAVDAARADSQLGTVQGTRAWGTSATPSSDRRCSAAASRCFKPLSRNGRAARRGPRGTGAASGRTAASMSSPRWPACRGRGGGAAMASPSPPGASPPAVRRQCAGPRRRRRLPAGDRARRLTRSRTLHLVDAGAAAQRLAEAPQTSDRAFTVALAERMLGGDLEGQRCPADAAGTTSATCDLFTRYLAAPA